jgi:hypothetical protein
MERTLYLSGMTKSARDLSRSDITRNHAAVRDAIPGIAALVASQLLLELLDPRGSARVWNLVPLVPALWLAWAQVRALRRADELQRVQMLEAMAVGFGAMVVLSLSGGLLDAADLGDPRQSLQITLIAGVVVWVIALVARTRRNR